MEPPTGKKRQRKPLVIREQGYCKRKKKLASERVRTGREHRQTTRVSQVGNQQCIAIQGAVESIADDDAEVFIRVIEAPDQGRKG